MYKIIKVVLLSLIAILQVLTLVAGFTTYEQMYETISRLQLENKWWYEEAHPDVRITPGLPNFFAPLLPLVLLGLLGLFLTAVLLFDQLDQLTDKNGR